jgi:hypothetical protein
MFGAAQKHIFTHFLQGKDAVPDTVDHVLVRVDPAADASWLQSTPKVSAASDSHFSFCKFAAEL